MPDIVSILRKIPLRDSHQSIWWRYGVAVLVSLVFLAARWLVGHFIFDDGVPFAKLFFPHAFSALYSGGIRT
jgi:hypothetical protein